MATARGTAFGINMIMNSAIKGTNFLQASVKGVEKFAKGIQNVNLLKATKFPVLNRQLESTNKQLRKLQQTSAKISRTPMDLGVEKSRDTLKTILRETKAVERATKQTAFYSQKDAENRLRAVRASRAEATALTTASRRQAKEKTHHTTSAGAVVGTAMALSPLVMPLKTTFDFEYAMARVKALSGADKEQFAKLRNSALDLSASTKYKAKEVAQGQQFLTMAGFKTDEIVTAMPSVLSLATAGDIDLKTTADIASNIMGGFEIPAKKMAMVSDVLAKTITTANVDIQMLGESMKYTAPIAKKAGLSLSETSAMAGLLGNIGIQGSMAGTTLKSMITRLSAPPTEAKKALKKLHIQTKDSKGNTKSIPLLLQELYEKTKDQGTGVQLEYMTKIFGLEPLAGGSKLIDLAGKGELKKYISIVKDYEGTANRISQIQLDTVYGQAQLFGSAIDNLAITMSSGLLPTFTGFIETMIKGVNVVKSWADENPNLAGGIYGVGLALGTATVALMTFGLVTTLAGKGIRAFGFGSKKACNSLGCVAGNAGKANTALTGMNSTVGRSASLFSSPLMLTVGILGVSAVLAGLSKIAEMSHRAIGDNHTITPTKGNLSALQEKEARLKQRIADAKGENGLIAQGSESFVHGANSKAKIAQLEKLLARTRRNIATAKAGNYKAPTLEQPTTVTPAQKAKVMEYARRMQRLHGTPKPLIKPTTGYVKPIAPASVEVATVESPTSVTATHLAQQNKTEVHQDNSQTTVTNHYTIVAKGTDAEEVLALIKQHERANAIHKRDTQLKD